MFKLEFVLATAVCVLLLLICPAAHGGYASTHGPVTALRSLRAAWLVFAAMVLAARGALGHGQGLVTAARNVAAPAPIGWWHAVTCTMRC